ncbi:MAG: ABC transporter substrate-binding protein [Ferrovibrionaceae bacterium]
MFRSTTIAGVALCALLAGAGTASAQATKVRLLLDWGWTPYHSAFLLAEERGYFKDAGLDVTIEQGRGSNSTAILVGQGGFDIGHLNVTNAAHSISKGVPIKVVALYQHKTAAAFIGMADKVKLTGPDSLKGLKIGSTPGGSDGLSMSIFRKANNIPDGTLNIVSLDANTKTAALLNGQVDVVSGDSHAYKAIVRGAGKEPVALQLADYGVPLLGFGFAANNDFLKKNPEAVKKLIAASRRGFQDAAADPDGACKFIQSKVNLPGKHSQCVDYMTGLFELSTPATDASWGRQTPEEWARLIAAMEAVGEIPPGGKKPDEYYTNEFVQ